jgi:hypothetical protein
MAQNLISIVLQGATEFPLHYWNKAGIVEINGRHVMLTTLLFSAYPWEPEDGLSQACLPAHALLILELLEGA